MRRSHALSIGLLTFALSACGSSDTIAPVNLSIQAVSGSYRAAHMDGSSGNFGVLTTTTSAGVVTDELGKGADIRLVLNSDGTTAGHITIPGSLDDDLTGTWALGGNQVTLNQSADTFLRDIAFTANGNQLDGTSKFSGTTVHVTLLRR